MKQLTITLNAGDAYILKTLCEYNKTCAIEATKRNKFIDND